MKYTPVIGLEIHAELKTRSKIFCSCENGFGDEKNSHCCPVCAGLPGALPVINREAVIMAIKAGLSLGSHIANETRWDRKNYFYPDSPKAYQISQLYAPLCIGGGLTINNRFIRLNHIHLEEDAGKLIHANRVSQIDLNRCGVPLIEIVTEPDLRSSEEATEFVEKVRNALVYAGVCDGKMEEGSLRVDANVSIMPIGSTVFGTRTETKNLNSFKFVKNAIDYEIARQAELLDEGKKVIQETRRFNADNLITTPMRSKEDAEDYRYFPDPDIKPLHISNEEVSLIASTLPEPPYKREERYEKQYGFSVIDSSTITANKNVADFFDKAVELGGNPLAVLNAFKGSILRLMHHTVDGKLSLNPVDLVYLLKLQDEKKITGDGVKSAIAHLFAEGGTAEEKVKELKLIVQEDDDLILKTVKSVIDNNPQPVNQYREGNEKIWGFLFGQCNRILRGKATVETLTKILKAELTK